MVAEIAVNGDSLTVVMPVYNERAVVGVVVEEWCAALDALGIGYRWVVVDDGSTDGSAKALAEAAARHPGKMEIVRQENAGHGSACRRGYEQAATGDAEWALQIDSDGQCDPEFFAAFWKQRAEYDCVFGRRTSRGDGLVRRVVSAVCAEAASAMSGIAAGDVNVPYRLMRRSVLARALQSVPAEFELQNVALTVALRRQPGIRFGWEPIHFRARADGKSGMKLWAIVRLGWTMVRQRKGLRGREE